MSRSTYVVHRTGREPFYLQSFKVAQRLATTEAGRGTTVGRIKQDGTVSFLRPRR